MQTTDSPKANCQGAIFILKKENQNKFIKSPEWGRTQIRNSSQKLEEFLSHLKKGKIHNQRQLEVSITRRLLELITVKKKK